MFYSLLLTCDTMIVRLIFLDFIKTFQSCFLIDDVYPIYLFPSFYINLLKITKTDLNNYNTFNGMGINQSLEIIND